MQSPNTGRVAAAKENAIPSPVLSPRIDNGRDVPPLAREDLRMQTAKLDSAQSSLIASAPEKARSTPSPAPVPDLGACRSMTVAEFHAGLLEVVQGNYPSNVLVFDIRPMESYVQGHVKWRRLRNNPTAKFAENNFTGLIHVEPEWLNAGVNVEYVELCLRGFTSAGDPRRDLFKRWRSAELIVAYDGTSKGIAESQPMGYLMAALLRDAQEHGRSFTPSIISGGFAAWEQFLKSSGLTYTDWVEIGDGRFGEDWVDYATQEAVSVLRKPVSSSTYIAQQQPPFPAVQ
ncbi:hypothetical protein HK405_006180, partial [Cladochytrium tenue]